MQWWKSGLAALPMALVVLWMIAGIFGARLAPRPRLIRWSRLSRCFHWTMAFAVLGTTSLMYYSQTFEAEAATNPAARAEYARLLRLHKSIGLIVLFLVAFRFLGNRLYPRPPLPDTLSPLQKRIAVTNHYLLYVLMLTIPLLGWFASMAYGGRTHFFGLFELPILIGKNYDAAVAYRNGHIWLGWLLFAMLVLHIGAALWHHWVKRDATLAQMLPWGRSASN
ncbi:MAG: cytochrome b [Steroidobacteraceae bacterium]|nr:cytochrome b [Steroidobacteraceae bacterium]MDW8257830.1 cytochrome b [Gammaproteobacteria bacterium]